MAKKQIQLWPNGILIDIIGTTGKYGSGKTLFVLSIDPANTRHYDFEKSGCTYGGLGAERIDVPSVMLERHKKGYSPRQLFEWWYSDIKQIEPGQYSVIAGDPISDIEDGLVDWVKARHKEFGFKTEESFAATGGIFWSRVKSEWKRVLSDLAARCQTFAFTTHLKFVWKAGKPTNQQEAKGKSTLMELASLFLWLERDSGVLVPSATVLKSRLAVTSFKDGEMKIVPVLPPRLQEATPKRIREYIVNPPDYGQLTAEEVEQEKELSAAEKLEMEMELAANNRAAQEAALEAAKVQAKIIDARAIALARLRPTQHQEPVEGQVTEDAASQEEGDEPQEDPRNEDIPNVSDLIQKAEILGKIVDLARGVYKSLQLRGVDVSGFSGPDALRDYTVQLKIGELRQIDAWLTQIENGG